MLGCQGVVYPLNRILSSKKPLFGCKLTAVLLFEAFSPTLGLMVVLNSKMAR
jgi:hypothetical protein